MSDLLKYVTPLTRGIFWLAKDETNQNNPRYSEIDYLLDGLLTANLKSAPELSSRVIIGESFNKPLFVMIAKEIIPSEIDSYLSLLKDLTPETDILVIDEVDGLTKIKSHLTELKSHLRIIE